MKYSLLCKARYYLIHYLDLVSYQILPKDDLKNVLQTITELTDEIDKYGEEK